MENVELENSNSTPATPAAPVPQSTGADVIADSGQPIVEHDDSVMQSVPPGDENSQSIGSNAPGNRNVQPSRSSEYIEDGSNAVHAGQMTESDATVASNQCVGCPVLFRMPCFIEIIKMNYS